jgi:DnaJ-class molecular chaperone
VLVIETPRRLSEEQERLLRAYAETEEAAVQPKRRNFFQKLKGHFSDA